MSDSEVLETTNVAETLAQLDPVFSNFSLPLRGVYYPLGFAVEVSTNSAEVLVAAEESWGRFRKAFSDPPVRLDIGVIADDSKECPPAPGCRARGNLLTTIADAKNYVVSDLNRGFAFAWLTQAAVEHRAYLRYYFLEATALTLLDALYLTPLHAACVEIEGQGLLLCGESGAGKSSLAFACARKGWKYLSDDSSAIVRKRKGRVVVGNPHQMRFRESAIELFPELKEQRITPRFTGKMAIELATSTLPEIATITECQVDYIVFLNRREPGPPSLRSLPEAIALQYFQQCIFLGDSEAQQAQRSSLDNLLTASVLEMRYRDLDWAVQRLETLVQEGT
ncbi:MAG TPA: aldolase [Terriglobales bacterium]|nr:aldolase [Terriglobales bacterium]